MPLTTPTAVTVTTTAGLIATPTGGTNADPISIVLHNDDAAVVVYLGGSDVTAATGSPLAAGAKAFFSLPQGSPIYGITSASTASVRVLQEG